MRIRCVLLCLYSFYCANAATASEPLDGSLAASVQATAPTERIGLQKTFQIMQPASQLDLPIWIQLDDIQIEDGQAILLLETTGGTEVTVPSQLEVGTPRRLWWILTGTPQAVERTFQLQSRPAQVQHGLSLNQNSDFVEIRHGTAPILRYNMAHVAAPAGLNPRYGRSAYIHPLHTPSGATVTEQFPTDHGHQSAVFLAYVKTEFSDRHPDFWNLAGGTGRVRFKALLGGTTGPVYTEFQAEHEHVDLSGSQPEIALREIWSVRVWNAGGRKLGYWICDIKSTIECATSQPLILPKYHYGGMALRGAQTWGGDRPRFVTSEGLDRKPGNHSRPRWCDISGPVERPTVPDAKPSESKNPAEPIIAGLTLMTHPQNFRFPEPLRIHPTMPYMVYTPSQVDDWKIEPGKPHVSRYRFVMHDEEMKANALDAIWQNFGR